MISANSSIAFRGRITRYPTPKKQTRNLKKNIRLLSRVPRKNLPNICTDMPRSTKTRHMIPTMAQLSTNSTAVWGTYARSCTILTQKVSPTGTLMTQNTTTELTELRSFLTTSFPITVSGTMFTRNTMTTARSILSGRTRTAHVTWSKERIV